MRYKEQVINQIERLENMNKSIETAINRNETRQKVLEMLEIVRERLDQLKSQVNLEYDN